MQERLHVSNFISMQGQKFDENWRNHSSKDSCKAINKNQTSFLQNFKNFWQYVNVNHVLGTSLPKDLGFVVTLKVNGIS